MHASDVLQLFKSRELRLGWLTALTADALQIIVLPLFVGGILSPADTIIDAATALILSRLVGWHWAFVPTFLAELVPGLDLFPTWSAAMAYVSWQRLRSSDGIIDAKPLNTSRFLQR
jgi:hypothetical protein